MEGGDHVQTDRSERSEERERDSADAARERSDGAEGQGHHDGQPPSSSVPAGHTAGTDDGLEQSTPERAGEVDKFPLDVDTGPQTRVEGTEIVIEP